MNMHRENLFNKVFWSLCSLNYLLQDACMQLLYTDRRPVEFFLFCDSLWRQSKLRTVSVAERRHAAPFSHMTDDVIDVSSAGHVSWQPPGNWVERDQFFRRHPVSMRSTMTSRKVLNDASGTIYTIDIKRVDIWLQHRFAVRSMHALLIAKNIFFQTMSIT